MTEAGRERVVLYEQRGRVGVIVLSRPERANAISAAMRDQLHGTKDALARDPAVQVVIVTGAGPYFCGGADLKAPAAERAAARRRHPGATDFSGLPQPVIAVINGAALGGGCELALTCDFRFMADGAQIGLPEIRFGALPLGGGTARLPRLVGPAAARRIIMTGEPVSAREALRLGLVDFVYPPGLLRPAAQAFAERLAGHPGYALRAAKTLLNSSLETSLAASLERERAVAASVRADPVIEAAVARAASLGVACTVVVVDASGSVVATRPMAGAAPAGIGTSMARATTALLFAQPTMALTGLRPESGPPRAGGAGGTDALAPGGVPITDDAGRAVGAVGACGGTPDQDHQVALAAATAYSALVAPDELASP